MKKISLLIGVSISIMLASCSADANDVELMKTEKTEKSSTLISPAQAKSATLSFFSDNKKIKPSGIPDVDDKNLEEIQTLVNDEDEPVIYVLNLLENKGFVVMSASLLERPILAYANEGRFDLEDVTDYEGVSDWLMTKFLKINGLEEMGTPWSADVPNQWNALGVHVAIDIIDPDGNPINWVPAVLIDEDTETYGPLLGNIKWDQWYDNDPSPIVMYNNYVRYNNCSEGTAPVGCGAVAMGQIMKYHNHPNMFNIAGMYPYITDEALYNYNTQPALDVASFLGHIANNVNSYFYCDRSGGASANAAAAFSTHYDYTTSSLAPMNINTIRTDIINNKPIYLRGNATREVVVTQRPRKFLWRMTIGKTKTETRYSNGHAWVGDGYEKITGYYYDPNIDSYFYATIADHIHMNWGWGGRHNGWYDYDMWTNLQGIIEPDVQFIYNQEMIYNITPN